MNRRWMAPVLLAACAAGAADGPRRPNILFAFADDWGRHAGAYAKIDGPGSVNDVLKTPHFDRLAGEGVLFRSAFVSAPSCTPCRSALISGQHFWRTGRGAILRGAVWDGSNPSYMLLLHEAGYHIGKTYKVWAPGVAEVSPHGDPTTTTFEKAGGRFNQFSQNATKMAAQGRPVEEAKQALYDEVAANFESFLAARKPGQPFCYWFGPTHTHRKWIRGSGKALWGIDPDSLKGKMPPYLPDVPEVREDLADYFGEAQAFDAALGLLRAKLEAIGELDTTLFVISGDHGAPGFPHGKCNLYDFGSGVALAIRGAGTKGGRVVDDLVSLTDLAPTFLELGGVRIPDVMTGRSLARLLASPKSGRVEPERSAVFVGRERHVENARDGFLPYPQRAIRTHEFSYIVNFKPDRWPLGEPYRLDGDNPPTAEELTEDTRSTLPDEDSGPAKAWLVGMRNDPKWKAHFEWVYGKRPREELYDLAADPHQARNLAADPAYARVRAGLEKRLMDELRRTGDPRLIDDGRFFETPPMAGWTSDVEKQGGGKTPADLRRGPPKPAPPPVP
jgi:arylsulfatase A-like enzyme